MLYVTFRLIGARASFNYLEIVDSPFDWQLTSTDIMTDVIVDASLGEYWRLRDVTVLVESEASANRMYAALAYEYGRGPCLSWNAGEEYMASPTPDHLLEA